MVQATVSSAAADQAVLARAIDGEAVPRASVKIEQNSRGVTYSVGYTHPDADVALRTAIILFRQAAIELAQAQLDILEE